LIHLEAYHHFPAKSWGSFRKLSSKNSNNDVSGANMERDYRARRSTMCTALRAAPKLLPDPLPNSIGNFFENTTDGMSFIQCFMLSIGEMNDAQYGVGFPVDMPVMLTYFEGM
jgi:hypothetical protein